MGAKHQHFLVVYVFPREMIYELNFLIFQDTPANFSPNRNQTPSVQLLLFSFSSSSSSGGSGASGPSQDTGNLLITELRAVRFVAKNRVNARLSGLSGRVWIYVRQPGQDVGAPQFRRWRCESFRKGSGSLIKSEIQLPEICCL